MPIAFLLTAKGVMMLPLNFPNEQWPEAIHEAIAQTQAHGVVIQSESWVVIDEAVPDAVMSKLQGLDLQDYPGRLERITSMMELNDGSPTRQLHIDIAPDGSLGETNEYILEGHASGRLAGFFPTTSHGTTHMPVAEC